MDAKTAFSKYVDNAGGRAEAAKKLGITVGMVGHVLTGVRNISVERAKMVEAQTDGRISRAMLRPDVFGPAPEAKAVNRAA
jgi:DNA-binding transcriptional regulator YdaS (Cro superfamily)